MGSNDSDKLEQRWSKNEKRQLEDSPGVVGCKIEDGVRADGVASLIVAAGERRGSLGVGVENMMRAWVMK